MPQRKLSAANPQTPQEEKAALLIDLQSVPQRASFFISLVAEGEGLHFYGTRYALAKQLTAIGYPITSEEIQDGRRLDFRCRVQLQRLSYSTLVQKLLPLPQQQEE